MCYTACRGRTSEVKERLKAHQLPNSSMEDIQTLIRVSGQKFKWLIFCSQKVKKWQVGSKD
jgi:hypothetical protein